MAKWFFSVDGRESGPIESTALKLLAASGYLTPNSQVRREDMTDGRRAGDVKGLFTETHIPPLESKETTVAITRTIDDSPSAGTRQTRCSACGNPIVIFSRFCTECGAPLSASDQKSSRRFSEAVAGVGTRDQQAGNDLVYPRNPPLSPHLAWLTILWWGIPQFVFGQYKKGLALAGMGFVLVFLGQAAAHGNTPQSDSLLFSDFMLGLIVSLPVLIDAYMVGGSLKSGKAVGKWRFFPFD